PALPDIASSRELEVLPGFRRAPSRRELTVPPAASEFPALFEPAAGTAKRAGKSRPAKSTQKTRPQPKPAETSAAPSADVDTAPAPRSRNLVWLILLMVALGAGAMAAAYYLPDL
ncbi:MAG TPA: hypothetical protein VF516_23020, partial [Kofleriaceae bacterium]